MLTFIYVKADSYDMQIYYRKSNGAHFVMVGVVFECYVALVTKLVTIKYIF